mgnify:CR=1 FL=1
MNPTVLKSFVALAELGSFQTAAVRIGIAQPTLSQHIKKLEEDLGAPLIQRSHSGSRLTDAGLRLRLPPNSPSKKSKCMSTTSCG